MCNLFEITYLPFERHDILEWKFFLSHFKTSFELFSCSPDSPVFPYNTLATQAITAIHILIFHFNLNCLVS